MANLLMKMMLDDKLSPVLKQARDNILRLTDDVAKTKQALSTLKFSKKGILEGGISHDIAGLRQVQEELKKEKQLLRDLERAKASQSGRDAKLTGVRISEAKDTIKRLNARAIHEYSKELQRQADIVKNLDAEKKRLISTTELEYKKYINQQRAMVAASNRAASANRANLITLKSNIAAQKEIRRARSKAIEKAKQAAKQARINARLNSQEAKSAQKSQKAYKSVAEAQARYAKATKRTTNEIVRHIRQAESLFVAVYAVKKAYDMTLGVGHEFLRTVENETAGLKLLVVQNLKNVDAMGRSLSLTQKYAIAGREASKMMKMMREINPETPFNLSDTIKTYKAIFPQLKQYGATLQDIADITKKMTIVGKANNMDPDQFIKTIDTAFTGNMKPSQIQASLNRLGISNETIKSWIKAGTLIEELKEHLKEVDAEAMGLTETWDVAVSNFTTQWQSLMGDMSKPVISNMKETISDLTSAIKENRKEIAGWASSFASLAGSAVAILGINKIIGGLSSKIIGLQKITKFSALTGMSVQAATVAIAFKKVSSAIKVIGISAAGSRWSLRALFIALQFAGVKGAIRGGKSALSGVLRVLFAIVRANPILFTAAAAWGAYKLATRETRDSIEELAHTLNITIEKAKELPDVMEKSQRLLRLQDELTQARKEYSDAYRSERMARGTNEHAELQKAKKAARELLELRKEAYDKLKRSLSAQSEATGEAWKTADGASATKDELDKAANAAARLAQNLGAATRGLQVALLQAQNLNGALSGDGLIASIDTVNLNTATRQVEKAKSNVNMAALLKSDDMGRVPGIDKYTAALKQQQEALNTARKHGVEINVKLTREHAKQKAFAEEIKLLNTTTLDTKKLRIKAAEREIEVQKQVLAAAKGTHLEEQERKKLLDAENNLAKIKAQATYDARIRAVKKAASAAKKASKKAAKDRVKAHNQANNAILKDAKKTAEDMAGMFKSALSQIFHGDIAGGIESLFRSIGDKMMEPALDAMSTSMASKLSGILGTQIQQTFADNVAAGVQSGMSAGLAGDLTKNTLKQTVSSAISVGVKQGVSVNYGAYTKVGGHRNWRNNNPGNIEYGKFTKSAGAIGTDGRFAIFATMEDGFRAQMRLLQSAAYRNLSLSRAIAKYAPAFENNPRAYLGAVSGRTGVSPNRTMGSLSQAELSAVVKAMAGVEGMKAGKILGDASQAGGQMAEAFNAKMPQAGQNFGKSACGIGGKGGAFGGLIGGMFSNFLGKMFGAILDGLLHRKLTPEEIESVKGQSKFKSIDAKSLANAYKDAQYPLLQANLDIKKNTYNLVSAFDQVAALMSDRYVGLSAGVGGVDPTGSNYASTQKKVLFGLFSSSSQLIGSGYKFSIDNFVEGFDDIQTYWSEKVSKSYVFGLFTSESIKESFKDVDPEVASAFNKALQAGYNSILDASVALGFDRSQIEASLKKANLKIGKDGKIDTKGLSQEEAAKRVSQAFNDMFSGAIEQVGGLDRLTKKWQEGTEQEYETLLKLASITTNVRANMKMAGFALEDFSAKAGNMYGLIADRAAYSITDQTLDMTKGAANGGSLEDGLKKLQAGFKSYFSNFLDATEQYASLLDNSKEQIGNIAGVDAEALTSGMNPAQIKEWYKEQLNGLDRTTTAGNEAFGALMATADEIENLAKAAEAARKSFLATQLALAQLSVAGIGGDIDEMILGAGSKEALESGMKAYVDNFLSDSEQYQVQLNDLTKRFKEFDIDLPDMTSFDEYKEWFTDLLKNGGLSDETKGGIIPLSNALKDLGDAADKATKEIEDANNKLYDIVVGTNSPLMQFQKDLYANNWNFSENLSDTTLEKQYNDQVNNQKSIEDALALQARYAAVAQKKEDETLKELKEQNARLRKIESYLANIENNTEYVA